MYFINFQIYIYSFIKLVYNDWISKSIFVLVFVWIVSWKNWYKYQYKNIFRYSINIYKFNKKINTFENL